MNYYISYRKCKKIMGRKRGGAIDVNDDGAINRSGKKLFHDHFLPIVHAEIKVFALNNFERDSAPSAF